MKISTTSSNAYKKCKRSYYYYKTAPFKRNLALIFGTAFETGFEQALVHGLTGGIELGLKKFWEQKPKDVHKHELQDKGEYTEELLESNINEALELLPNMVERLYSKVNNIGIKFLANQSTLVMDLDKNNKLDGRFDGVVEYEGRRFIWELKSYKTYKSEEDLQFDSQVLNYLLLARERGFDVDGVLFCQVKKKIPNEPKILKGGNKLSVAKNQGCDPEEYLEYAKNMYDEIPEEVISCYESLTPFIKLDIITVDDKVLDNFKNEMTVVANEMDGLTNIIKSNPKKAFGLCYTNRADHCSWCNYKKQCREGEM